MIKPSPRIFLLFSFLFLCLFVRASDSSLTILVNQVAYNTGLPKTGVVSSRVRLPAGTLFQLVDSATSKIIFTGQLKQPQRVNDWQTGRWYSPIDFSACNEPGQYRIRIRQNGRVYYSFSFLIGRDALTKMAVPSIASFFYHQRAASPEEREADQQVRLYGSDQTVDLTGGWCDASGDVSKYFSHLAYTNFMSPQQIPMVDWSLISTVEKIPALLEETNAKSALIQEALYGADYIVRDQSPDGYFYMTVFSYFDKDPHARRVVGLLADSKTTADYQCAWREGGGMAVAALARIAAWKKDGAFTSGRYLAAAEKGFAHLQQFSTRYADDGKDNVIDDYCALMAATELWITTGNILYRTEARIRAGNLANRLSPAGYFIANDTDRPFWHAADAGLPVIALARYLDAEWESSYRNKALATIKKALDYNLRITNHAHNPFGYPRQHFLYKGKLQEGFFIPHENESGWWWQGEDARLGSLAAAMLIGGRLVYPGVGSGSVEPRLAKYASRLISWVLGTNPYNMCMMYGYGHNNVPYMVSMYGHGSGRGGISNGITGKDGHGDGSGIDFKTSDNGNEWRWSEQWIPHSSWFLQAVTALAPEPGAVRKPAFKALVLTERGGVHEGFVVAALDWLKQYSAKENFEITVINNPDSVNTKFLSAYQLFIQLNFPPYRWNDISKKAFQEYIEKGIGGWIGFHHASLLGEFDGYPMWDWFSGFLGGIRWKNYIAARANATVYVEDSLHPVMKGLPAHFSIPDDEWYTYDLDPRPNVHVIARVDEASYEPGSDIRMGDHPVIWCNEKMAARNVYFQMGHHEHLFTSPAFTRMFANAIRWASGSVNCGPAISRGGKQPSVR